nr:unnamed protein product [Callosobruchus analis]
MMDPNPDNFNFAIQVRCFDMITLSHLHREGPANGITIVLDMQGVVFGHFLKLSVVVMKKLLYYLQIQIHTTMENLYAQVPKDVLPQDYGGSCESLKSLHDTFLKLMAESEELFKFQEKQLVDESRRPGKPKSISDVFGMEGTFKKLEVD